MRTAWTYLVQKDEKTFALEKHVVLDHRIWSLHELIDIFEKAGWGFKAAYPGLERQQEDAPLTEAKRLFFIATKSPVGRNVLYRDARTIGENPAPSAENMNTRIRTTSRHTIRTA
jgi:hypothetical protein